MEKILSFDMFHNLPNTLKKYVDCINYTVMLIEHVTPENM